MAKKPKLEIVERKISELIESEYNPRRITEEQEEQLTASIVKYGCVEPIIINMHKDRKNIVIGGHRRMAICKRLKYSTIPTVELKLELKAEKELNLRLNKNQGEFDLDLLSVHFDVPDLLNVGFTEFDLGFGFIDEKSKKEKDIDSDGLPTKTQCPKCSYEW